MDAREESKCSGFCHTLSSNDKYSVWLTLYPRSPEDVCRRLDILIAQIRETYHNKCLEGSTDERGDVLVVAHGHILRAFAMRWVGKPLTETALILEAGGVGTLRYALCTLCKLNRSEYSPLTRR
jgi:broad specificity phosphatase PhoE